MKEDRDGWWDVPPLTHWKCPECNKVSPVEDWEETEIACDLCGSHDARMCPQGGEVFDHVWGSTTIAEAQDD